MKTKAFILITIIVIFVSCSSSETNLTANSIEGNWFYIDPSNGSYNELYFSKELFIYNLRAGAIGPVFHYQIINDSIYIDSNNRFSSRRFFLKVKRENEHIFLEGKDGERFRLIPLKSNVFDWKGITLRREYTDSLRQGWFDRYNEYFNLEFENDDSDSIDIENLIDKKRQ